MPEAATQQIQINNSIVRLVRGDITELDVDTFVFYAQSDLTLGSGFGTAISVRGGPNIQKELEGLAPLSTGQVVVTGAGNLKAASIIHAVGPRFNDEDTEDKLRATVLNSLNAAEQEGARSIAMPPMGAGFHGVALELCARVMIEAIKSHLEGETEIQQVVICVMDRRELAPFESRLASLNR